MMGQKCNNRAKTWSPVTSNVGSITTNVTSIWMLREQNLEKGAENENVAPAATLGVYVHDLLTGTSGYNQRSMDHLGSKVLRRTRRAHLLWHTGGADPGWSGDPSTVLHRRAAGKVPRNSGSGLPTAPERARSTLDERWRGNA